MRCSLISADRFIIFVDICLGTNDIDPAGNFVLYPNPASEMVQIYYSVKGDPELYFSLSDITGRLIKQIKISDKSTGQKVVSLDTQSLSTGVYFVEMHTGDHLLAKKLVISK